MNQVPEDIFRIDFFFSCLITGDMPVGLFVYLLKFFSSYTE